MDIVILADFCGRFNKEGNSRFLYLANILCENHTVEVVTSDFDHATKTYFKNISPNFPYKVTMLHEGSYKRNVCLSRFGAHYIWGKSVADYLKKRKNPDIIYCAVPTLKASYEAAKYCEKNNVRFIIDVQDLWPEAFQMVFHIPIISNIVFAPFQYLADGIYKRADEICAVSQTYVNRALQSNKKCKNGYSIFLGTELETFDKNTYNEVEWNKEETELWLGYCGTLGSSYDLTCVIDALSIIKGKALTAPKFIVMGEGPRRKEFEGYAQEKGVECIFTGLLPYPQMCALLVKCDMVVNPITHGAAQSIINKHADYAASGLPVLNTQECKEYRELVEEYDMGFNCENNDAEDLAKKLVLLTKDAKLREEMGSNARKCAEECFDRRKTYENIIKLFL